MNNDFYCDSVLSGRLPVRVVAESANVLAFEHTKPTWHIHIVVTPKQHVRQLIEVQDAAFSADSFNSWSASLRIVGLRRKTIKSSQTAVLTRAPNICTFTWFQARHLIPLSQRRLGRVLSKCMTAYGLLSKAVCYQEVIEIGCRVWSGMYLGSAAIPANPVLQLSHNERFQSARGCTINK